MEKTETAVFGGGCFWCTEAIFKSLKGVVSVVPGYAGGTTANPSYADVCSGKTSHAEVIKIEFDPGIIPYEDLLEVFLNTHDPTSLNRQGNDVGTQYRSIILYTTYGQKEAAERLIQPPMATEIKPLENFYEAEDYHRDYYDQNKDQPYCRVVISPKLKHLREKYSRLLMIRG